MKQKFKVGDVVKIKDTKRIKKNFKGVITTVRYIMSYLYSNSTRKTYELDGIKLYREFYSNELEKATNAEALVYLTHEPFDEDKQ